MSFELLLAITWVILILWFATSTTVMARKLRTGDSSRPRPHALAGCAHCGANMDRAWGLWAVRHYRRVDDYPEWVPADDLDCCSLACLQAALRQLARED